MSRLPSFWYLSHFPLHHWQPTNHLIPSLLSEIQWCVHFKTFSTFLILRNFDSIIIIFPYLFGKKKNQQLLFDALGNWPDDISKSFIPGILFGFIPRFERIDWGIIFLEGIQPYTFFLFLPFQLQYRHICDDNHFALYHHCHNLVRRT